MPQFDFFYFYDCFVNFSIVFLIFIIFINGFLLPLIYKINYLSKIFLTNKFFYLDNVFNFYFINTEIKKLFFIKKIFNLILHINENFHK